MKIEVGKVYDNRVGGRILILCQTHHVPYPCIGITLSNLGVYTYNIDGSFGRNHEDIGDLIALSEDQSHDIILPNVVSERKKEPRRAIQLVINEPPFYALCNDGTIWLLTAEMEWRKFRCQIPEFDEVPEAPNE